MAILQIRFDHKWWTDCLLQLWQNATSDAAHLQLAPDSLSQPLAETSKANFLSQQRTTEDSRKFRNLLRN